MCVCVYVHHHCMIHIKDYEQRIRSLTHAFPEIHCRIVPFCQKVQARHHLFHPSHACMNHLYGYGVRCRVLVLGLGSGKVHARDHLVLPPLMPV
jgi:hypothetical protein